MTARKTGTARKPTKPSGSTGGSLARYRADAGEPFRLEIDDDQVIEIPRPSGKKLMDIAEKYADLDPANPVGVNPREQLADLLGDAYDDVMPVLEAEDFSVMIAFLNDLVEHFGLGEALASFS